VLDIIRAIAIKNSILRYFYLHWNSAVSELLSSLKQILVDPISLKKLYSDISR
jgi:hypothetical protein